MWRTGNPAENLGTAPTGSANDGTGTHDNGTGNGANPKDFERGSNPGKDGGGKP